MIHQKNAVSVTNPNPVGKHREELCPPPPPHTHTQTHIHVRARARRHSPRMCCLTSFLQWAVDTLEGDLCSRSTPLSSSRFCLRKTQVRTTMQRLRGHHHQHHPCQTSVIGANPWLIPSVCAASPHRPQAEPWVAIRAPHLLATQEDIYHSTTNKGHTTGERIETREQTESR
jgi:hypothetical protein